MSTWFALNLKQPDLPSKQQHSKLYSHTQKNKITNYKASYHTLSNKNVRQRVCVSSQAATPQSWRPAGSCWFGGWAGWRWQTRLSLWKQPWQRHKDTSVNHTAKKPWQQNWDWSRKHFDLAGMENVRLQRIQASMNPQEMGQGNYSAMVDLIEAGLWSNDNHLHGRDSVCESACVRACVCMLPCSCATSKCAGCCVCVWKMKRLNKWVSGQKGKKNRKTEK